MSINQINSPSNIEEIVRILAENRNYQILKRFEKLEQYHLDDGEEKLIGIYLDTETTGLDHQNDKIIELALVPFEYNKEGKIFRILNGYSGFQDPKMPLTKDIRLLTGITDDMVRGRDLDNYKIESLVTAASLIVAHNATFDRNFVEKQFPIFKEKAWCCSLSQIPWKEENISSAKLEYLAYKFGFFYEAHRAETDCLVGLHILTQLLPVSQELALKTLLQNTYGKSYILWATNAPYDSKDILKSRGYRWSDGNNGKHKAWYIEVNELTKAPELEFLMQNIYKRKLDIPVDEINPFNRFTAR